jgi:hypothetical protein
MAILVRDSALQWSLAGISCVYKTALSGGTAMAVYEKQVRLPADVLEQLGDHSEAESYSSVTEQRART